MIAIFLKQLWNSELISIQIADWLSSRMTISSSGSNYMSVRSCCTHTVSCAAPARAVYSVSAVERPILTRLLLASSADAGATQLKRVPRCRPAISQVPILVSIGIPFAALWTIHYSSADDHSLMFLWYKLNTNPCVVWKNLHWNVLH